MVGGSKPVGNSSIVLHCVTIRRMHKAMHTARVSALNVSHIDENISCKRSLAMHRMRQHGNEDRAGLVNCKMVQ